MRAAPRSPLGADGWSLARNWGPAFQNLVLLEDVEDVMPRLKIQSLAYLPADMFLEEQTTP